MASMTALEYGIFLFLKRGYRGTRLYDFDVLEFGVYKGDTLRTIVDLLVDVSNIYGFDSFEGLPEDWSGTSVKKGHFACKAPYIHGAEIFSGWFEDTIPKYREVSDKPIGLLHLDADLYSSTRTVLDNLNDRIEQDTLIVCDEWFYNFDKKCDDHEQKAVKDWAEKFGRDVRLIDYQDPTVDMTTKLPVGMERAILHVVR